MGNFRPIKTACWIRFLESKGLAPKNTVGSHTKFTKKGLKRPIPVWTDETQIPAFHLKKGCETLGVTLEYFYEWAKENC